MFVETTEVVGINPQFALRTPATEVNEDPAVNKRFEDGFRKAGLN